MEALQYNTKRKSLIIPEYGRHIHLMIDQVHEIEDREKRNKMARAIIGVMGNLNPHLRDVPDFQHKLWDQLFIMSDFKLDVDSPFEKPQEEVLKARPQRISYPVSIQKYRFYGNNISKMIMVARGWEEGEMKDALVYNIANHMKKCFLNWNKDSVEDTLIFEHLKELSENNLKVNDSLLPLTESSEFLKARSKHGNGPRSNNSHIKNRNKNKRGRY
ncbi:MAG: methionyl-tRNA formyltransferase [Flavobacteriaceae bacterium]|nr:methionyl-tRNA formyltransferase [Flavobacteriaceae bacterium]|tara:strand:- start:10850 stop:11497 length:648 start_codon:yes stop_codon:yes gene_type:complete